MLKILASLLLFAAGFACGAFAFVGTQARPLPRVHACLHGGGCLSDPQVLGLLTSAGLRFAPGMLPDIVGRSDKCVGIRSQRPEARIDLVFFPTRDIRNLFDLTDDDEPYLMDCLALMRQVAEERKLRGWKIISNGPGAQEISYLHLHLVVP